MRRLTHGAMLAWLAMMAGAALAFDNGQYDNVPPDIRAWFKSVIAPNGVPCCDISDGHRTSAPSSAIAAIRSARPWCGTCTTAATSSSAASFRRTRSEALPRSRANLKQIPPVNLTF
jgi:hypothetical protein